MYRANYVDPDKDPMVYIASHTWPDRFTEPREATIEVYSNADSVKLYNSADDSSLLGTLANPGRGHHFEFKNAMVKANVLRAVAYRGGEPVATDLIVLNNLPKASGFDSLVATDNSILAPEAGRNYVYRINAGGDEFTDSYGNTWMLDDINISRSWAQNFKDLSPYLASQGETFDPIAGTPDWKLMQTFRYGRHELSYNLPLPNGKYQVELFFIEPWHGTGGGEGTDVEGLRIFDVAVNDSTVIDDLDIWAEGGHDKVVKRTVDATVTDGMLRITFPEVKAGQAVISAIAVSTLDPTVKPAVFPSTGWNWERARKEVLAKMPESMLPKDENARAAVTYQAEDAKCSGKFVKKEHRKEQGVFFSGKGEIEWTIQTGLAQVYALRFKYMNTSGEKCPVNLKIIAPNGSVLKDDTLTLPVTPEKWKLVSTTTGSYINAGTYRVIVSGPNLDGIAFDSLQIQ